MCVCAYERKYTLLTLFNMKLAHIWCGFSVWNPLKFVYGLLRVPEFSLIKKIRSPPPHDGFNRARTHEQPLNIFRKFFKKRFVHHVVTDRPSVRPHYSIYANLNQAIFPARTKFTLNLDKDLRSTCIQRWALYLPMCVCVCAWQEQNGLHVAICTPYNFAGSVGHMEKLNLVHWVFISYATATGLGI